MGLGSVEGVMKKNNYRKWRNKPFSKNLATPANRKFSTREAKMCCQCGAVTVIGGDALGQSKTLERFFCDIECAGEFKKWHNKTVTYKAKVESNEWVQQRKLRGEKTRSEIALSRLDFRKSKVACCSSCGIAFERVNPMRFACSERCRKEIQSARRCQSGFVTCRYCGLRKFEKQRSEQKMYCSDRCQRRYDKQTREHKRRTNGPVDVIGLKTLARKQKYKCEICGVKCVHPTTLNANNEYSMDHIIPLSKGGTHTWDNVQLACRRCNGLKSDTIKEGVQLLLALA